VFFFLLQKNKKCPSSHYLGQSQGLGRNKVDFVPNQRRAGTSFSKEPSTLPKPLEGSGNKNPLSVVEG
jgi:hypothetical protein